MNGFYGLIKRFGRDESGVFAVLFGLMAIILIALGGSVVDYVRLEQTRNRAQVALDAAALALQPEIFKVPVNQASIKANAQALMIERIADPVVAAAIETITIDVANGSLFFEAKIAVPTIFVQLVGVPQMTARIHSEATRKKLSIEVAMVLDNSGSMKETGTGTSGTRQRMQFLKDAARCATYILFYKDVVDSGDSCVQATTSTKQDSVKIGVVPFTMFVNVGASNLSAGWIDQGSSVTSNDNFDDGRTPPGNINRATLFTATKESWDGCIEARPHIKTGSTASEYLDTDDTLPVAGNTLYLPMLAPDVEDFTIDNDNERDTNNYLSDTPAICDRPAQGNTSCVITQQRTCTLGLICGSATTVSAVPRGPTGFTSSSLYANAYYGNHSNSCSCRNGVTYDSWSSGTSQTRTGTCTGGGYQPQGLSVRQLQERICKYYGPVQSSSSTRGPNADCGAAAILPLSDSPTTVVTSINNMVAEGGTNIHEGAAWGYRVLSPTAPFTEGKPFAESTSKVMILMTDGENTTYNLTNPNYCNSTQMLAYNGSCYNSAYGYPYNSRNNDSTSSSSGGIERLGYLGISNASLVTELNLRTVQACTNAKAQGITIYTIGLATEEAKQSTPAVVRKMLTDCASTTDKAYFPAQPSELKSVFLAIAGQLAALRLAQ